MRWLAVLLLLGAPALADCLAGCPAPDLSEFAKIQDLPQPANTMPPGVGVDGATGSTTQQFALANHTHATSVQRVLLNVTANGNPVTWTFLKPYDQGVTPTVICTPKAVAAESRPFTVNVVRDLPNPHLTAQVKVFQAAQPTISILGISLTLFSAAPTGTVLDCIAGKPTQ